MGITYRDEERERLLLSMLDLFYAANRKKVDWSEMEELLVQVPYDNFTTTEQEAFIGFLAALGMRVWHSTTKEKVNQITETETGFVVKNYDWRMYKWVLDHGVPDEIVRRDYLGVPISMLDEEQIKWFRSKI